jgi:hypothetical protein
MAVLGYGVGDAFEVPVTSIQKDYESLLAKDEVISKAFKLIRDMLIFTNKRLLVVDKQGLGAKIEYLTIPYKSVEMYSMQSAGMMERDSEIALWVKGQEDARKFVFRRGSDIQGVYKLIGDYVLK